MTGELWRDVVNFVGDRRINPELFQPLLAMIAERHAEDGYFLGRVPKVLTDTVDRPELEVDIRCAQLGYKIWLHSSDRLLAWANLSTDGPFGVEDVKRWWFSERTMSALSYPEHSGVQKFISMMPFTSADRELLGKWLTSKRFRSGLIPNIRRDLHWLVELATLRQIALKTWPAAGSERQAWTDDEFRFVDGYYSDQQPFLTCDEDSDGFIDPFTISPVLDEQNIGFGLSSLSYCLMVVMRSTIIDFVDDILDRSRFPMARGSLQCTECGVFVGRRALGYGQLYCGSVCKSRAAKRRQRQRQRRDPSLALSMVV